MPHTQHLAISQIVTSVGPICTDEAYQHFVKAAGRQRVGKASRSALNRALSKAVRDGQIVARDETGEVGFKERILSLAGTPKVVVRTRGSRDFVKIPPSEVATLMVRLAAQESSLTGQLLHRRVLDFYGTKRMTANIEQRLKWIEQHKDTLLGDADGLLE